MRRRYGYLVAILACCWAACAAPETVLTQVGDELVTNGAFAQDEDGDGWPDGWTKLSGAEWTGDEVKRWMTLRKPGVVRQSVPIQPHVQSVTLTGRFKATDVVPGTESWKNARVVMEWKDADGKYVNPWPKVYSATGTQPWQELNREYKVPARAASLLIGIANLGESGVAELADLSITMTSARPPRSDLPLPEAAGSVAAIWDHGSAWRQASSLRESISINGLWRFYPITPGGEAESVAPAAGEGWGWFKVPGIWPRESKQSMVAQDFHLAPCFEGLNPTQVDQAWYQREIAVPADWAGSRIVLRFAMLNTHARAFVDGQAAGELFFPGGELDITNVCKPGARQRLELLVTARPLGEGGDVFMAPDRAFKTKASVKLKGISGDVYLERMPMRSQLADVSLVTSVKRRQLTVETSLTGAALDGAQLAVTVLDMDGKTVLTAKPQTAQPISLHTRMAPVKALDIAPLVDDETRWAVSVDWADAILWETDNPYLYTAQVQLLTAEGTVVDESLPIRFGFREFEIRGRDFYLNGIPIHLRALQMRNANEGAGLAQESRCRDSIAQLHEYGFNFMIMGNYSYRPGQLGDPHSLLRAADETGMLISWSLPHISDYGRDLTKPGAAPDYLALSRWAILQVRNHPSVVVYAMNHNATGYKGDQNPWHLDGEFDPSDPAVGGNTSKTRTGALIAEHLSQSVDPTRPIYHHQSGNLGQMHTLNIYLNWAPRQERADWLEQWSQRGTKPVFFVEWGLPHIASFSSYRGPLFIWRNDAYQQFWDAEFAAPLFGDGVYEMTDERQEAMITQQKLWARGKAFRWSALSWKLRYQEKNLAETQAWYAGETWKGHRMYGSSAMLPWDQNLLWKQNKVNPRENEAAMRDLQRPGIVADRFIVEASYNPNPDGFTPTALGEVMKRYNASLIGWIGGEPDHPTEKGHTYRDGEPVEKSLVLVNDTRRPQTMRWTVTASGDDGKPYGEARVGETLVAPGTVEVVPLRWERADAMVQAGLGRGFAQGQLTAAFAVGDKVICEDSVAVAMRYYNNGIQGIPEAGVGVLGELDTLPETIREIDGLRPVKAGDDFSDLKMLVIARGALTPGMQLPGMARVRDGLRVLVLEQSATYLQNQLGFRVQEHQLRRVFPRLPEHPVLKGRWPLRADQLHDWRGASTHLSPYVADGVLKSYPTWFWAGYENTRVWRSGNWGTVASTLIEKPPVGNFRALVDGGFDLQYAPLLEYREGKGLVLFCQMDVSGRTVADPAAEALVANMIDYLQSARLPTQAPGVQVIGDAAPIRELGYAASKGEHDLKVIVGDAPQGVAVLEDYIAAAESGATVVAVGLTAEGLQSYFPDRYETKAGAYFPALLPQQDGLLAGVNHGDLYWPGQLSFAGLTDGNPALRVDRVGEGAIVLIQPSLWPEAYAGDDFLLMDQHDYWRKSQRRFAWFVGRVIQNAGGQASCPLLARFSQPGGQYNLRLDGEWLGKVDKEGVGQDANWFAPELVTDDWKPVEVPGSFDTEAQGLTIDYNGLFWYRYSFEAPERMTSPTPLLEIGAVDDESWVWLNCVFLGEISKATHPDDYYRAPRSYTLPAGMLRHDGPNTLVILANDRYLGGGLKQTPRLTSPGPWIDSYYVQEPRAADDPYRYYRW